ncbi:tripartite tricarboxylate transporter TctB family protein [Profundibacterium mesophilum]|uniref:Tripartite tricarboxylate transporter TctB family domain containing protein n=1 Tax=Profundibacterium mesophilum KAUST100406-0324 TaxID=1037889 RepID=A0A921NRB8_9RHOB|nr:tripartite tricarboxylate transporter TctB family protein [Profundibacterium mesophilum]KAF0677182.1 Tripartite tricarboxylate transporter TctB family domain containing protein [Profundibacterium mesophilum KAUST100406-0324]
MALDRWIALIFVAFCCAYGYLAFFTMDELLPPFMQRNPVWPSTFPKVLSVLGIIAGLIVLTGLEAHDEAEPDPSAINWRRLHDYNLGQALLLLGLMVVYALALRPAGFLPSTVLFLALGAAILGERRWIVTILVAVLASGFVWWLVERVLGIFLRPFPTFL